MHAFYHFLYCPVARIYKHDANPIPPENRLIVFTSHKPEVYAPIIKEFELRTGISVEVQAGGTTEMLEKIKNGEDADVMFGWRCSKTIHTIRTILNLMWLVKAHLLIFDI